MSDFTLGQPVRFRRAFTRHTAGRFTKRALRRGQDAVSCMEDGAGFVVGIRNVVMANYHYTPGWGGGHEYGEDYEAPSYSGTRENVLLVTIALYTEPVLVRYKDVML